MAGRPHVLSGTFVTLVLLLRANLGVSLLVKSQPLDISQPSEGSTDDHSGVDSISADTPTADGHSRGIVMSCPVGTASHNNFGWKPANIFEGFKTTVKLLRHFGCKLPIFNVIYNDELPTASPQCEELHQALDGVFCVGMNRSGVQDYGYSKVYAVRDAPVNEAMFIDCDAFFVRDPTYLFDDGNYTATGALFWPDFEGHFASEGRAALVEEVLPRRRASYGDQWWFLQGYDSGLLIVNKRASAKPFGFLLSLLEEHEGYDVYRERLNDYSNGDKDLWHYAWLTKGPICDSHACSLVPLVSATGASCDEEAQPEDAFHMSSQAKLDSQGNIVALHQIWPKGDGNQLVSPSQLITVSLQGRSEEQATAGAYPNDLMYGIRGGGTILCRTLLNEFQPSPLATVDEPTRALVMQVADCWHKPEEPCEFSL